MLSFFFFNWAGSGNFNNCRQNEVEMLFFYSRNPLKRIVEEFGRKIYYVNCNINKCCLFLPEEGEVSVILMFRMHVPYISKFILQST